MSIFNGDRHKLGEYVRDMADLIGLRDWTVGIADDPPESDDDNASIDVPYGRRVAMIHFAANWDTRDPEDLRRIVAHELIHCHLWSMDQRVCDLHDLIGKMVYEVIENAHKEALEHAVDGIATAWSATLPLPIAGDAEATDEQEAA